MNQKDVICFIALFPTVSIVGGFLTCFYIEQIHLLNVLLSFKN
ncbi:hypothetical protein SAMN05216283_102537 [Sunxiuqinia elliptica]|uniref:Uncharacterized protein n=1 Tax=Sunxiuqinia elliptica TaxID=655355 RepID=A0A1I2FPH6_9BACT|nr:hypothetical protein SAMN05216283_102537 [Sunxiuqinia elliptica]